MNQRVTVRKLAVDGSEAVQMADSKGRSAEADVELDGSVRYAVTGTSPQNEDGVDDVCTILMQRLNQKGGRWTDLQTGTGDVDRVARDGQQTLAMQVTRAATRIWQTLGTTGRVDVGATIEILAAEMWAAIQKKSDRIPPKQRPGLVLVLDARETAAQSFPVVVAAFRKRFGEKLRLLGFKDVWLVGPTHELTSRLVSET